MGLRKTTTPRFQDTEFRLKKITLGYPYHDTNQHGSQVINLLYIYKYICIINILPGATSNNLLGGFSPPEEKKLSFHTKPSQKHLHSAHGSHGCIPRFAATHFKDGARDEVAPRTWVGDRRAFFCVAARVWTMVRFIPSFTRNG